MKTCDACAEYRGALRGMKRSFAALTPIGFAPFALAAKIIGVGSGAGSAAAGGAAAGGGVAACKVAAVVCTAAIATGGAVEVQRAVVHHSPPAPAKAEKETTKAKAVARTAVAPPVVVKSASGPQLRTVSSAPFAVAAANDERKREKAASLKQRVAGVLAPPAETKAPVIEDDVTPAAAVDPQVETGGTRAPDAAPVATPAPVETPAITPPAATPTAVPATPATQEPVTPPIADGGTVAPPTAGGITAPPAGG
jgi:hypothetical protein